jgi:hypothetical protein
LMIKGSLNWFHIVSPYGGKVIEYWIFVTINSCK